MQMQRNPTVGRRAVEHVTAFEHAHAGETGPDGGRRERQLELLQEWCRVLGDEGYVTLLSISPPMRILVRTPGLEHRWLAMATSGLLIVFEQDGAGRVRSDYHLIPKSRSDSAGPSARAALQAAIDHLAAD
jgi:hypothetical protein